MPSCLERRLRLLAPSAVAACLLAAAALGCGPAAITAPPFSAAELRDATVDGRSYLYRTQVSGEPAVLRALVFREPDADGATMVGTVVSAEGVPLGEPTVGRVSWAELESHGVYPEGSYTVTDVTVEVPAGRFDAWLFTVREDDRGRAKVSHVYFAKRLPGMPVQHVITLGGEVQSRMQLMRVEPAPR